MSKKFNCSMQKKIESLAKKSETKKSESDGTSWALDYLEETAKEKGLKVSWEGDNEICITIGTAPHTDRIYVTDDAPGKEDTSLELYVPAAHINTSGLTLQDVLDYLDDPIGKRDAVQFKNGNRSGKVESKKSEGIEDQPEDVQKMVKELAEYTDNDVADANIEDYAPGNGICVTFGDEEYYCYADKDDAEAAAQEGVKDFLEMEGIAGIRFENIGGIEQFLDVDWFKDAQREDAEFYVSDIKESEPERYKEEFGDIDEEDAVEKCLADWGDDYIQWFKDNFGEKELDTVIKENNLVDLDALAEAITDADGPANELASYDGEEIELPCGYYCYRHN